MRIKIDGELFEIDKVHERSWYPRGIAEIEADGCEFLLAIDSDTAEKFAKDHYRDMDARELICMVGEERIVAMWTRGETLEDWLKDLDTGQELAGYDGNERTVNRCGRLIWELGWTPQVAYRTN